MSDLGDLIAVGLLNEPNALGLTANEAHAIGERIAPHLRVSIPLDAAWAAVEAVLPEDWVLNELLRQRWSPRWPMSWRAVADLGSLGSIGEKTRLVGEAPTPVAALLALRDKLAAR